MGQAHCIAVTLHVDEEVGQNAVMFGSRGSGIWASSCLIAPCASIYYCCLIYALVYMYVGWQRCLLDTNQQTAAAGAVEGG